MTLGKSEVCKYGNYRQAKGESESHGCSHLNPNPRTNKQIFHNVSESLKRSNLSWGTLYSIKYDAM